MDQELPRPSLALVIITQSLLGALFLVGAGVLAILPSLSSTIATSLPEFAGLRDRLLALALAMVVLGLLALIMVSLLVHRIHRGTVLTRSSVLWVDVIVATIACHVVLLIVGLAVIDHGQAGSPWLALILGSACIALLALGSITLVLRSLLRHAISIRSELDEVV